MFKLIQLALLVLVAYTLGRRFLRSLNPPNKESPPAPKVDERDPHDILGVSPGASETDLRRAYQAQIRRYHPDYLENMAPELRRLAEQRTKEINRAYEALRRHITS